MEEKKQKKVFSFFSTGSLLVLILLWHIAAVITDNQVILPTPSDVLSSFFHASASPVFYKDLAFTLLRSSAGLIISVILGVSSGALMGFSPRFSRILSPLITGIQATPAISWLLIALVWFDPQSIPVILVVLATFPIITINTAEGIMTTDTRLLEMARVFEVPGKRLMRRIYLPEIAGYIRSSFRITVGFSLKVGLMAEVLSHPGSGIGERLSWARINVEMPDLIMYTALAVILTLALSKVLSYIEAL